jgi:hypothetical protein
MRVFDPEFCEKRCPVCTRARQGSRPARFLQNIEMILTFGGCPWGRARQQKYGVRPDQNLPEPSGEVIARKLVVMWDDPAERERVRAELHRYGQGRHERGPERVRLAILKLCEARVDRVTELVTAAQRDYRDVLLWAEYPAEGKFHWASRLPLSDEERRRLEELRKQDRQQYQAWLKE